MMEKRTTNILFTAVLILTLLSINSLALADCAVKTFTETCKSCPFKEYDAIDEICAKNYTNKGTSCLAKAYPLASFKYGLGDCPSIESCVNALETCINIKCPGTDKEDCSNPECITCYQEGDRCVARAAMDCQGTASCGDDSCEADKGENKETCCTDCGCENDLNCRENACVEKTQESTTTITTTALTQATTTLPRNTIPSTTEPATKSQGQATCMGMTIPAIISALTGFIASKTSFC